MSAKQLAAALGAPDQVSRDLLAAALYVERSAPPESWHTPTLHLLNCVSLSLASGSTRNTDIRQRVHACAQRLYAAHGTDLADFTKAEAIDLLVAAAHWEIL